MKLPASLPHRDYLTSVYSAKQVLENEAKVAQSQNVAMFALMERAGAAVFKQLTLQWPKASSVCILAGKGNNGGDGFVVARLAKEAGLQVTLLLACNASALKGDALRAFQAMQTVGMDKVVNLPENICSQMVTELICEDVLVDALFGIGFYGELSASFKALVMAVNHHRVPVISIDVPSGLCATTGHVSGNGIEQQSIIATITVTFIVYKQGLLTGQSANFVGKLFLSDLSLGEAFIEQISTNTYFYRMPKGRIAPPHTMCFNKQGTHDEPLPVLSPRLATSHKGHVGLLLTVGGNQGMPGAIRLASEAALRCGASLVSVCCHEQNQNLVFNGRPELMLAPSNPNDLTNSGLLNKAKAMIVGPGLGQDVWAKSLCHLLFSVSIKQKSLLIIDADALLYLPDFVGKYNKVQLQQTTATGQTTTSNSNKASLLPWVLTPHPKEAAALLGCDTATIEADRFLAVRTIAQQYGVICVLKGAGTLISDGKQVSINSTGNAGMASGGMGDVLSGIIAAVCMQSDENLSAVSLACYLHGRAADIIASEQGQRGMLASDLITQLQHLVNQ